MSIPRLAIKTLIYSGPKKLTHTYEILHNGLRAVQQKRYLGFQAVRQKHCDRNLNHKGSSSSNFRKVTVGAGIVLFSLTALSSVYSYAKQNEENQAFHEVVTIAPAKQLERLVERLYPNQTKIILQIYDALALTSLLNHKLSKVPEAESLNILNQTLQELLLRPKGVQRYQLNDEEYLKIISEKLKTAYQRENIEALPLLDVKKLRNLLLQESLWRDSSFNRNLKFDAVFIMGSTYQEYLNRQNYFFNLISSNKIQLYPSAHNVLPVYLLGGDRPLHNEMDMGILPFMKEQHLALNEQSMMDWMFDETTRNTKLPVKLLKRISTASPNESEGKPTTGGTLISALSKLNHEERVLIISSAPFIRYQRLVTERILLQNNRDIQIAAEGPNLKTAISTHPKLAESACIAICLDNLAREMDEMKEIAELKEKDLYKLWVR